jgi:hypothetical protein
MKDASGSQRASPFVVIAVVTDPEEKDQSPFRTQKAYG